MGRVLGRRQTDRFRADVQRRSVARLRGRRHSRADHEARRRREGVRACVPAIAARRGHPVFDVGPHLLSRRAAGGRRSVAAGHSRESRRTDWPVRGRISIRARGQRGRPDGGLGLRPRADPSGDAGPRGRQLRPGQRTIVDGSVLDGDGGVRAGGSRPAPARVGRPAGSGHTGLRRHGPDHTSQCVQQWPAHCLHRARGRVGARPGLEHEDTHSR